MANSTFIILDEMKDKDEKKESPKGSPKKPTDLDVSKVTLIVDDGETLKSPKLPTDSPRSSSSPRLGGSPRSSGLKRSPRLEDALRAPSPPREEEFRDAEKHEQVVRRKSSGNVKQPAQRKNSFSIKLVRAASSDSHEVAKKPEEKIDAKSDKDSNAPVVSFARI